MADLRRAGGRLVPLLAVVLLASGLSACSAQRSYCSALKDDQKQLHRLAQQSSATGRHGTDALGGTVTLLSELRDEAPDDISGDWDTLVRAVSGLSDAIDASGADPSDFGAGRRPAGVTEGQYRSVEQAAAELQATPVQQAGKSIEQHARDVCKVDLGAGLGGVG